MGSKQQSRRYTLATLVVLVVVAVAAGCGGGSDESSEDTTETAAGTPTQTITIDASEYKFDPSTVNLDAAGTYEFEIVNKGSTIHALEIEGGDVEEETEPIPAGESGTLTITLDDDTTYELYCPIDSHKDRGMEGSIVVGTGSSSGDTDDDDDNGSSAGY